MTQDITVAQHKDNARNLNKRLGLKIPLTGTKADLTRNITERVKVWNTETKNNRSTEGITAAVKQFIETNAARTPGTFQINGVKARIVLFGKPYNIAKSSVMLHMDETQPSLMQEKNGKLYPQYNVGVSHAIIRATNAKAKGTTTEGAEMASLLLSANTTMSLDLRRQLMDQALNTPGETSTDGLFTAESVRCLVEELNEEAPDGFTIAALSEGITFDEFILYDYTVSPKTVDSAKFAPSGMFKVEMTQKRGRGKDRVYLEANPPAFALLDKTAGHYMTQTHRWFGEVLAFRANALSRFGLIDLATPFKTEQRMLKGFTGKMEANYSPRSEHGIPRDDGIAKILSMSKVDLDQLLVTIADWVQESKFVYKVHFSAFIRGSKTDTERQKQRQKSQKDEKAWFKDGKKGRKPRRFPNFVAITANNIGDLKASEIIKVFTETFAEQGRAASMMNILAAEERQVEPNSGITPNIVKILELAERVVHLSAEDKSFVDNLNLLQEQALFRPWGWKGKVHGTRSGNKELPTWATQGGHNKRKAEHNRKEREPKGGGLGFAGQFGYNHGCVQIEVTNFAGANTITFYLSDLSETAISNREKYGHKSRY